jgi:hypothetical protein
MSPLAQFLDAVEDFLNRSGGTAPFARIGQVRYIPQPTNFPQGMQLRELCEKDKRFELSFENPTRRLEISLAGVVEYKRNLISYLLRKGGQVLFSDIGQTKNVSRPDRFPSSLSLTTLLQYDERFEMHMDDTFPVLRKIISLKGVSSLSQPQPQPQAAVPPQPPQPAVIPRDEIIEQFLDNVKAYLKSRGGISPFSQIGQVRYVPRHPDFPAGVSVRELCENDPRFELFYDQNFTPPRLEISFSSQNPSPLVPNVFEENVEAYCNAVAVYLQDDMVPLSRVAVDVPLHLVLVQANEQVLSVLQRQPERFGTRVNRENHERYVYLNEGAEQAIVQPVVDIDYGSPADLSPALPQAQPSWITPYELQLITVDSGRVGSYTVNAPLELKNKDYLRRLLDVTSDGLRGCVAHIMGKGQHNDIYYMLKNITEEKSSSFFKDAFAVTPSQFALFLDACNLLLRARNQLMHMNFMSANNAATAQSVKELFATGLKILGEFNHYCCNDVAPAADGITPSNLPVNAVRSQVSDAIKTMIRLRMQHDWHMKWNAARFGAAADVSEQAAMPDLVGYQPVDLDEESYYSSSDEENSWEGSGGDDYY